MPDQGPETFVLLESWRCGDGDALTRLLERDFEWISAYVHRRLGKDLRRVGDTGDFVQEAVLRVLEHGPRFVLSSREQFRALLATIVLNVLRAKHRELFALKRTPRKEKPLGSDTILYLDPPQRPVTRPDVAASREEEKEWLRLALLLLKPDDQEVVELHRKGLTDPEIGERLGLAANTARMRRSRALTRLTEVMLKLKGGELDDVLQRAAAAEEGQEG